MSGQNEHISPQETLSVSETAAVLGICRTLCYECIRQGQIPTLHFGRRIRVPRAALQRLLDMTESEKPTDGLGVFMESLTSDQEKQRHAR